MSEDEMCLDKISLSARLFVGVIFTVLGLSFVATTGALYYEFSYTSPDTDWLALATFYSHLFIFFPLFGLVALVAFYVPCCAFTDMYMKHVPMGPVRFGFWFSVLVAISVFGALKLGDGNLRSIWEVKPQVLATDKGGPVPKCAGATDQSVSAVDCKCAGGECKRVPVLSALKDVRHWSQQRAGLGELVRNCRADALLSRPESAQEMRRCFLTGEHTNADACCAAQEDFGKTIDAFYKDEQNRSLTVWVHNVTLPLKIFFLLVVLVVGGLLALRRRGLALHYEDRMLEIERGVLVGALAMLFLPVMNLAFLQSSSLLYGVDIDSLYRSISIPSTILFGAWALVLLFFFFRDVDKDVETVGRIAGVAGSFVAASNFDLVINYFVRFAGSGADMMTLGLLFVFAVLALLAILFQPRGSRSGG